MSKSLAVALPEFSSRSVKGMFLQLSLLGGPYILPLSALHIAHTFCICERSSEVHHWLSSHMLNCTHFPMSSEATARSRRTPPCPKSWEPTPPTPQNKEIHQMDSNGTHYHPKTSFRIQDCAGFASQHVNLSKFLGRVIQVTLSNSFSLHCESANLPGFQQSACPLCTSHRESSDAPRDMTSVIQGSVSSQAGALLSPISSHKFVQCACFRL